MMEQCKEKLSIAMFTGQNQLRSDGLWGSWIRQHKKTLSRVSGKRKKKYHPNGCVDRNIMWRVKLTVTAAWTK